MRPHKPCRLQPLFVLAVFASTGFSSGCTDIRKTMGLESKPSDEFAVSPAQQKLEVPPDFNLLPPVSGKGDAEPFGPANAHRKEAAPPPPLTASEQALMKNLGPGLDLPGRTEMDSTAAAEAAKGKGLLVQSKKAAQKDVLNPEEEKKRLQTLKDAPLK